MQTEPLLEMFINNNISLFLLQGTMSDGTCTCKNSQCNSVGKHPYMKKNWRLIQNEGSVAIGKLYSTMVKYNLNLAAKTGTRNSDGKFLVVVDIDTTDSELIEKLEKHNTFSYRTGGGGYHFWFWSKVNVKNSVSLLANKVDIRGDGGYVVVPPSKHKSGNFYSLINQTYLIKDLPTDIAAMLEMAEKTVSSSKKRTKKTLVKKDLTPEEAKYKAELEKTIGIWNSKTVTEIREHIENGGLIPNGVRNNCLHRLLSSDRAKGVVSAEELTQKALQYINGFEGEIHGIEIERTVKSVMKYPVYNNQCENVHKNYVAWLKEKYARNPDGDFLQKLEEVDAKFFDLLKKTNAMALNDSTAVEGVSLESILELRKSFFRKHKMSFFSNYRPSLLAKKLKEIGFLRKRTKKNNLWVLSLDAIEKLCYGRPSDEEYEAVFGPSTSSTVHTTENALELSGQQEEKIEMSKNMKEIASKKIQVKVKHHPLEWKYPDTIHTEFTQDQLKIFANLPECELQTYLSDDELCSAESVDSFVDEVMVDDIIGVGFGTYKVTGKIPEGFECTRPYIKGSGVEVLTLKEIDRGIAMDRVDILYRDGKPYGQPEYIEQNVRIFAQGEQEETSEPTEDTSAPEVNEKQEFFQRPSMRSDDR